MLKLKSLSILCIVSLFLFFAAASYSKQAPDKSTIMAKAAKPYCPTSRWR